MDTENRQIKRISIVGAGTMGQVLGQEFARAGYEVVLQRRSRDKLVRIKESIRSNLAQLVDWGLLAQSAIEPTLDRIQTTTSLREAGSGADLVLEAVFEDLDLKRQIFGELDRICRADTILTSNTSSFLPSLLAAATDRPDRVLVFHFCYPPHLLPLVEVVPSALTSSETVEMVCEVARASGKLPVVLEKEVPGFIINRLQVALLREALHIVQQGVASAQEVDFAVRNSFGRRLSVAGPIEMAEVMDDWRQTRQFNAIILPDLDVSQTPSPLMVEKVEKGELGAEVGKGFYEWPPEYTGVWRERLWSALAALVRSEQDSRRSQVGPGKIESTYSGLGEHENQA